MKSIAVRLEDDVSELLALVAQLEDTSIVDQIRQAVDTHLQGKVAEGDLAERATAALDAIDREAAARKAAIGSLFEKATTEADRPKGSRRRSTKADQPPMGFAPPAGPRGRT